MALFGWGMSKDEQTDESPLFAKWWNSLPPEFKVAKGAARRQWQKLRPNLGMTERLIQAVQAQSKTRKWQEGYRTTPERWLRDERWEDYVEPEGQIGPTWQGCPHTPQCASNHWCLVVQAKERGEA